MTNNVILFLKGLSFNTEKTTLVSLMSFTNSIKLTLLYANFSIYKKPRGLILQDFLNQAQNAFLAIKGQLLPAFYLVALLWGILLLNTIVNYRLNWLGILPRHLLGLIGIPFYSFIHGSFNHLFFNSFPLFVLLAFMLTMGLPVFLCATIFIIIANGLALWLFGRMAIHIGASGLIMGYWGYLLLFAYEHPSILSYILAIVCVYYFGSLLLSIFPSEERVSWEGHLFGLLAGIGAAYFCPLSNL
jgi:membrane associated rhomboid family serine protease